MPNRPRRPITNIIRSIENKPRRLRKKPQAHERIHRTARRAEPKLARAFRDSVAEAKAETSLQKVQAAIESGQIEVAVDAVPIEKMSRAMRAKMGAVYADVFTKAGQAAGAAIGLEFSVIEPAGLQFIEAHGAEFIRHFGATTHTELRGALANMVNQGLSAHEASKQFRDSIGLTKNMQEWVTKFGDRELAANARELSRLQKKLEAGGAKPSTVDRLVKKRERELAARLERRIAAKQRSLERYRADMIARTEAQNAATGGFLEANRQAVEQGLIDPAEREVEWLTSSAPCEICDPMNGQRREVGQTFTTGDGREVSGPGGDVHPSCLCSLRTVEKKARAAA